MLVRQLRRRLEGRQEHLLNDHRERHRTGAFDSLPHGGMVESTDDEARWWSEVHDPMTSDEVLAFAQDYLADPSNFRTPHDEVTLLFRLKATFVKHGYPVDGVKRMGLYD